MSSPTKENKFQNIFLNYYVRLEYCTKNNKLFTIHDRAKKTELTVSCNPIAILISHKCLKLNPRFSDSELTLLYIICKKGNKIVLLSVTLLKFYTDIKIYKKSLLKLISISTSSWVE